MRLYDLPEELRLIEAEIEETGGEITDAVGERLARFESNLDSCVDWYGALIVESKGRASVLSEEIDRLRARQAMETKRADAIRERLKATLEAMGRDKVKAEVFTARIQRNGSPSTSVNVPVANLPAKFTRTRLEVDTDAIKAAWKAGEALPEGVRVEVGTHLRIA
jgi:hypothetical protein